MKSGVCEVVKGNNGAIKMEDRVNKPDQDGLYGGSEM